MQHNWETIDANDRQQRPHFRCTVCKMLCIASAPVLSAIAKAQAQMGECPGSFLMPPNSSIQYSAKLSRWIKAKMPRRDAETVMTIWKSCCEPCEQRGKEDSICGKCACRVLQSGPADCNLIAMATEKCPIGKWA